MISIRDDSIAGEPDESFSVTLISATPNGVFEEDTTCITIIDDDSKWPNIIKTKAISNIMYAIICPHHWTRFECDEVLN